MEITTGIRIVHNALRDFHVLGRLVYSSGRRYRVPVAALPRHPVACRTSCLQEAYQKRLWRL